MEASSKINDSDKSQSVNANGLWNENLQPPNPHRTTSTEPSRDSLARNVLKCCGIRILNRVVRRHSPELHEKTPRLSALRPKNIIFPMRHRIGVFDLATYPSYILAQKSNTVTSGACPGRVSALTHHTLLDLCHSTQVQKPAQTFAHSVEHLFRNSSSEGIEIALVDGRDL